MKRLTVFFGLMMAILMISVPRASAQNRSAYVGSWLVDSSDETGTPIHMILNISQKSGKFEVKFTDEKGKDAGVDVRSAKENADGSFTVLFDAMGYYDLNMHFKLSQKDKNAISGTIADAVTMKGTRKK